MARALGEPYASLARQRRESLCHPFPPRNSGRWIQNDAVILQKISLPPFQRASPE